jgi:hypothetical protein
MRLLVARLLVALHRRNLLLGPFARFRIHVRTDLLQGVPTPPCPRAPTCACPWAQMTIYPTSCPLCSWKGGWQTLNSAGFAARRSGMQLCRTITPRSSSLAGIDIVAAALLIFGCSAAPLDPAGARGTAVAVVRAACGIEAHRPPAPLPPCHRRHGCCHQGPPGGLRCRPLRGLRSIRCRRLRALRCRCPTGPQPPTGSRRRRSTPPLPPGPAAASYRVPPPGPPWLGMPRMPTGQYARTVGELLNAAAEAEQRASVAFAAGAEWIRIFQTMHEQAAAWRAHAAAAQAHDLQMVEMVGGRC